MTCAEPAADGRGADEFAAAVLAHERPHAGELRLDVLHHVALLIGPLVTVLTRLVDRFVDGAASNCSKNF